MRVPLPAARMTMFNGFMWVFPGRSDYKGLRPYGWRIRMRIRCSWSLGTALSACAYFGATSAKSTALIFILFHCTMWSSMRRLSV